MLFAFNVKTPSIRKFLSGKFSHFLQILFSPQTYLWACQLIGRHPGITCCTLLVDTHKPHLRAISLLCHHDNFHVIAVNTNFLLIPTATPPQITSQPTTLKEITTGKPVTFSLQATGTEPLNYQWQYWKPEGEKDESEAWQDITCDGVKFQEVKAGLKLTAVQACDAGYYRCVVSNSAGSETSQCANLVVGKDNHSVHT